MIVERPGEIGIGVRDIGQIESFVETVAQAIVPSDYGDFAAAKTQLEKQLNVDLEKDVLAQLSGDISASISLSGDFGLRAEPKDPAAFKRTLAKVAAGAAHGGGRSLGLGAGGPRPSRRAARTSMRSRSPTGTAWCSAW